MKGLSQAKPSLAKVPNSGVLIHREKQHKGFVVRGRKELNLDIQWNYEHDEQEPLTSHLTNPADYAKAEQRSGMKRGGRDGHGEIIQVQGGHIVRAAGGKDRHSKVYTSKGPRDRRVRLSANTAIQFYDVQDRLGYDRPSKAVDWLITKARTAIDNLAELPGQAGGAAVPETSNPGSSDPSKAVYQGTSSAISAHAQQSITDTMRSFFPVSPEESSLMNMHSFEDERMSAQHAPLQMGDLGLSLHSLQDQNMNQMVFPGSNNPEMFEANYHKSSEASWNTGEGDSNNGRIGFIFNPHSVPQQLYFSQNSSSSAFSQREPLQSNSYSHPLNHHAWIANQRHMDHHQTTHQPFNQSAFYNIHFGSDFQVPSRIRGEEDTGGASLQQSSASPTARRH